MVKVSVARAIGDKPFARGESLAQEFARNAITVLQRRAIAIDVANLSVN